MFLWWELGEGIKDREGRKGSFGGGGVEIIKNGVIYGEPDAPSSDERESFMGGGGSVPKIMRAEGGALSGPIEESPGYGGMAIFFFPVEKSK
jgi:hypothetical protein